MQAWLLQITRNDLNDLLVAYPLTQHSLVRFKSLARLNPVNQEDSKGIERTIVLWKTRLGRPIQII